MQKNSGSFLLDLFDFLNAGNLGIAVLQIGQQQLIPQHRSTVGQRISGRRGRLALRQQTGRDWRYGYLDELRCSGRAAAQ
jgi:hypothetical protein